jgi:DNA polymerase III alpha subunit
MIRTGHSFKFAVGHLSEVVSRIKEIGWNAAPIADRTSTYGFVAFEKLAKKEGLRPVFGVELGVVDKLDEKRPSPDYFVFLARDKIADLSAAIAEATKSNRKKMPSMLYKDALALPGLIKIAGSRCKIDVLPKQEDVFVGLSPATPIGLYRTAKKAGHRFIALPSNLFPREADKEFYRVAVGPNRQEIQTYPQWIVSDEEWRNALWFVDSADANSAIANRERILSECRAELLKADLLSPPRTKSLREMCEEGARRTGCDLSQPVYRERLDRELKMIEEKNFADYFYILADIVSYSKTEMVVGPARGSSCGSLVCYLLDITAIDPIPFGLIFERFIDINRADLPDVDIDFSDVRRDAAFEYMAKIYGKEHVARLGTVNTYQPRSAMNTAAIALRVPQDAVDDVVNVLIKRSQGDNRASSKLEDTLAETDAGRRLLARFPEMAISCRMEEHPASAGQHAAGVVVTKRPIREHVPVDGRTGATMCDKYDAEALNLLKIDALGLTQLSVFERVAELTSIADRGWRAVNDWLTSIPLDDPRAFKVLNDKHFAGIFQFTSGSALAHFVEDMVALKPEPINSIEDMIALTALIRPGPLSSGGASEWMMRRIGRSPVSYPHPLLEPYLSDSLGIVIYQEQILKIGRELGDLSWEDVTKLRQAMSKSLGKEYFDQFGDRWKAGAIKRGLPPEIAERFWMDMVGFGAWAFNRAHSVAYGLVSYLSCYLKALYPVEYAAAMLDADPKPESQIVILRELEKEGIGYIPVDPIRSGRRWEITERNGRKLLVGPLINIENVGPVAVEKILQCRASKIEITGALAKRLENPVTKIDSLYPIRDAVKRIDLPARGIYTPISSMTSITSSTTERVLVVGVLFRVAQKDENTMVAVQRRRGRILTGPTTSLQLFLRDDSGDIFAKVGRYDFEKIGKRVLEHGRIGKAVWAVSGMVPTGIGMRMIMVENVRLLCDLDEERAPILEAAE